MEERSSLRAMMVASLLYSIMTMVVIVLVSMMVEIAEQSQLSRISLSLITTDPNPPNIIPRK